MALPVITDVFRVSVNWQNSGFSTIATNVMHFRGTGKTAAQVWTALNARVTTNMFSHTNGNTTVRDVVVTKLDGSALSELHTAPGGNWHGGIGATTNAVPQVAAIVKLTTAKRGRSYRGRVYLPFVDESQIDQGLLHSTAFNDLATGWPAFITNMTTDGVPMVVASYHLATAEAVTSALPESFLGTQRRRQQRK